VPGAELAVFIRFEPEVPAQVCAIPRHIAMILQAIHRYADTGDMITILRVADRKDAYGD
jgi:hypothetical protein